MMEDEAVRSRFRESAIGGHITCAECFRLAEEMGIPKNEIAATLTDMDIKIINCQLGCFP